MKKLFALSACALVLAACSNNGGTYYGKPQMGSHKTMQSGGGQLPQTTPPAAAANDTDKYLAAGQGTLSFPDSTNIHKLVLNNREIDLSNFNVNGNAQGLQQSGWGLISGRPPEGLSDVAVLNNSENMTVGVVSPTGSPDRFAFFNGKFTDEQALPSNEVSYRVSVLTTQPHGMSAGGANLTANFAAKTLKATDGLTFDATIKGNRFETAAGSETTAKGGFFGDNAMEIGGAFQKGEEVGVFYGAKKAPAAAQPQP